MNQELGRISLIKLSHSPKLVLYSVSNTSLPLLDQEQPRQWMQSDAWWTLESPACGLLELVHGCFSNTLALKEIWGDILTKVTSMFAHAFMMWTVWSQCLVNQLNLMLHSHTAQKLPIQRESNHKKKRENLKMNKSKLPRKHLYKLPKTRRKKIPLSSWRALMDANLEPQAH